MHLRKKCKNERDFIVVFSYGNAFMSQAIVNPEELRQFAQILKQFDAALADQMAMLSGRLESLSATWRDQENQRFREQFEQNIKLMARFIEINEEHIPFLLRKAERIEEYLQQR